MPNASPQSESGKRPPHLRLTAVPMRRVGAYGQLPGRGHGRPFWNTSQKQACVVQNPHTIPTSKTCRAECKAYDVPPSRGVSCTFLVPDKSHPPRRLEDFMLHCHSRTWTLYLRGSMCFSERQFTAGERACGILIAFRFSVLGDLTKSPNKHKPAAPTNVLPGWRR